MCYVNIYINNYEKFALFVTNRNNKFKWCKISYFAKILEKYKFQDKTIKGHIEAYNIPYKFT